MLIECPDCGRKVSDRAAACPDCACPVAEVVAKQAAQEPSPPQGHASFASSRATLERAVDCPKCEARGWHWASEGQVMWCIPCEATGRIVLCRADDGFYAVAEYAIARFLSGELHPPQSGVVFYLGPDEPSAHRYPQPAARLPVHPDDIPW